MLPSCLYAFRCKIWVTALCIFQSWSYYAVFKGNSIPCLQLLFQNCYISSSSKTLSWITPHNLKIKGTLGEFTGTYNSFSKWAPRMCPWKPKSQLLSAVTGHTYWSGCRITKGFLLLKFNLIFQSCALFCSNSFNWTDGQLWNIYTCLQQHLKMVWAEVASGIDKDGTIANVAQKCHLQLFFGKRIQREILTALNLSMGQNCNKHWDTFPWLSENKNINTNKQQWTLCAIQILPLTLC